MGWTGAAIPEEYGGAGLGHLEPVRAGGGAGPALAPVPFSSSVYLAAEAIMLAGSEAQKKAWLPKLAAGEAIGTLRRWPKGPARPIVAQTLRTPFRDGTLTGDEAPGPRRRRRARCHRRVAQGERGAEPRASSTSPAPASRATAVETIDPSRSHAQLDLRRRAGRAPATGRRRRAPAAARARPRGRAVRLRAGGRRAGRCLEMARDYALRALCVRPAHRLVPGHQAQARRHLCRRPSSPAPTPTTAPGRSPATPPSCRWPRPPRASRANEAFFLAAKENIQTHGGMGFTWEFDCHLYYRRAKLLALALGSAAALEGPPGQPARDRATRRC